jgi:hypothetical protein
MANGARDLPVEFGAGNTDQPLHRRHAAMGVDCRGALVDVNAYARRHARLVCSGMYPSFRMPVNWHAGGGV